jgi:hypothetical protein
MRLKQTSSNAWAILLCWLIFYPSHTTASTVELIREQIRQERAAATILGSLQRVPLVELQKGVQEANNYFEQGWLELGLALRGYPDTEKATALSLWLENWQSHPAVGVLQVEPTASSDSTVLSSIGEITVLGALLPLSGEFRSQGEAVLKGIESALAWERQRGIDTPKLEVFDSQSQPDLSLVVEQALAAGVDLMLGPMLPNEVEQLSAYPPLFPVLALNRVEGSGFHAYQLDLASDHELRQLVKLMASQEHRNVLVLASEKGAWIDRLIELLPKFAVRENVRFVVSDKISVVPQRMSAQIQILLGLDESHQRRKKLQLTTQREYKFESRIRRDFDAVLILAPPEQSRLIKPLLSFYHSPRLPVYTTSHFFSAPEFVSLAVDLDGVYFCDLPFLLRQNRAEVDQPAFFALGADAASVISVISMFEANKTGYFKGETGNLRLEKGGRFARSLPCAQLVKGRVNLIKEAD